MPHAYLGLGANLGDRAAQLRSARDAIAAWPHTLLLAVSPLYETEPVGGPAGQPPYLNAVLLLETRLPPREMLRRAHSLEQASGRERTGPDAPRTLDIDLLLYDDLQLASPGLTLPHPRMTQRRFVLAPLADLAPERRVPGETRTVKALLEALPERPRAERLERDW